MRMLMAMLIIAVFLVSVIPSGAATLNNGFACGSRYHLDLANQARNMDDKKLWDFVTENYCIVLKPGTEVVVIEKDEVIYKVEVTLQGKLFELWTYSTEITE